VILRLDHCNAKALRHHSVAFPGLPQTPRHIPLEKFQLLQCIVRARKKIQRNRRKRRVCHRCLECVWEE